VQRTTTAFIEIAFLLAIVVTYRLLRILRYVVALAVVVLVLTLV
jgi:hypothetical protein